MKFFTTAKLTRMGITAGLYIVLSLIVFPVASGSIQLRLSEALTLLPLVFPETAIGVFVGCALSNLITGCAVFDIILGSLITLLAGVLTAVIGKVIKNKPLKLFVGGLFPVLLNAFLLPLIWWYCYGQLDFLYIVQVCFLLISQSVAIYGVGIPACLFSEKAKNKGLKGFTN